MLLDGFLFRWMVVCVCLLPTVFDSVNRLLCLQCVWMVCELIAVWILFGICCYLALVGWDLVG